MANLQVTLHLSTSGTSLFFSRTSWNLLSGLDQVLRLVSKEISSRFFPVFEEASWPITLAITATSLLGLESRERKNFTYRLRACCRVEGIPLERRLSTKYL